MTSPSYDQYAAEQLAEALRNPVRLPRTDRLGPNSYHVTHNPRGQEPVDPEAVEVVEVTDDPADDRGELIEVDGVKYWRRFEFSPFTERVEPVFELAETTTDQDQEVQQ